MNELVDNTKYVKRDCDRCLFYSTWNDGGCHGQICNLHKNKRIELEWISGNDYDDNKIKREKYNECCEYKVSTEDVKDYFRDKFGIE